MCNQDIKQYAKDKNIKLWQIAGRLGINDGNFSRKLRVELPLDEKEKIKAIVDELSKI